MKRSVGERVRAARLERNLSLSELARLSGVAKATVSNIEAGTANPTVDTLAQFAGALRVDIAEFFQPLESDTKFIRASDMPPSSQGELSGTVVNAWKAHNAHLELSIIDLPAGARIDSEAHRGGVVEHLLLLEGAAKVGPLGEEVTICQGDYFQMRCDRPHSYEALDGPAKAMLLVEYP